MRWTRVAWYPFMQSYEQAPTRSQANALLRRACASSNSVAASHTCCVGPCVQTVLPLSRSRATWLRALGKPRFQPRVGQSAAADSEQHPSRSLPIRNRVYVFLRRWDRFILTPTTINSRCASYSSHTRLLAPGSLLCLASLPGKCVLRVCAADFSEIYYTFQVPYAQARRNCFRMKYEPHEVSLFSVFNEDLRSTCVYLALNTLAMGDSMAVEFAQQAHYNVLSSLGNFFRFEEVVAYRKVFPRSRTLELLSIDDHMTAQGGEQTTDGEWARPGRRMDC